MPSLHTVLLPKLLSVDLQNALFCHGITNSTASDQRTHFIAKEMWQWPHAHAIHWSYDVPHHPKAAGLLDSQITF